jgi:hypothetical protein
LRKVELFERLQARQLRIADAVNWSNLRYFTLQLLYPDRPATKTATKFQTYKTVTGRGPAKSQGSPEYLRLWNRQVKGRPSRKRATLPDSARQAKNLG